jgi:hypothetical protein
MGLSALRIDPTLTWKFLAEQIAFGRPVQLGTIMTDYDRHGPPRSGTGTLCGQAGYRGV